MDLGRRHPPPMMRGDMAADLDAALDTFDPGLPVVVVTTSACWYLNVEQRQAFPSASVMGLVTFESSPPTGRALALCHAHGAWMEWVAGT
jgi:hypothetical protein